MQENIDKYEEPLIGRYTSKEMQYLFSKEYKFKTWRKCWIALAKSEKELGLNIITDEMIQELEAAKDKIDYNIAKQKEKEIRHDVMAHVYEFGTHCPNAKGIIHLGATSQFVGCNTDLIIIREALKIIKSKLINLIHNLKIIANDTKDLVILGYTHYQPAQPVTIGKRICLYIQDLLMDLEAINSLKIPARGAKGTTGTQASYLELFDNDYNKVKELDKLVSKKLGFKSVFPITSQTYPRKYDTKIAEAIGGIGVSLYKFAVDLRLLSNLKIVDEPFTINQTGSSAMPYKRNPMRCERLCAISRKLIGLIPNFYNTAENQWFERTLDDSAIRRMDIPQLFLCCDAILILANNITRQNVDTTKERALTFYKQRINKILNQELPFMTAEKILVDLVKKGYDRQEIHELIKEHSVRVAIEIKEKGEDNNLFKYLAEDKRFPLNLEELNKYLEDVKRYAGCSVKQVEEYIHNEVESILNKHKELIGKEDFNINV